MVVKEIRRKTMTYNKPEIVQLETPMTAIQGTSKGGTAVIDTLVPMSDPMYGTWTVTVNAYEADE
jgi:hypothetical protein